jgi:superkiller protein 3
MRIITTLLFFSLCLALAMPRAVTAQQHDPDVILDGSEDAAVAPDNPDLDQVPDDGGQDYSALAKTHYDMAVDYHMKGMIENAVMEYRKSILLNPGIAAYHADLGEAYRLLGETRLAIEAMQRAIELDPDLSNAYTTLGVIYDSEGLLVNAVEYHRKAIEIDPDHYIAHNNLGHAYDRLGLIKAAMANYEKAIEINPDFAPAYDNLGTDYLNLSQVEKGIEMIHKALNLSSTTDPQRPLYLNDLGAAYVMKQEFEVAYKYFEQAARLAPHNQDIQRNFDFIKEYMNDQPKKR